MSYSVAHNYQDEFGSRWVFPSTDEHTIRVADGRDYIDTLSKWLTAHQIDHRIQKPSKFEKSAYPYDRLIISGDLPALLATMRASRPEPKTEPLKTTITNQAGKPLETLSTCYRAPINPFP